MVTGFRPRPQLLHGAPCLGEAFGGPLGKQDVDPGHQRVLGYVQRAAVDADRRRSEPAHRVLRPVPQEGEAGLEGLQRGKVFQGVRPQDDLPQPVQRVVRLEPQPLSLIGEGQAHQGVEVALKWTPTMIGEDGQVVIDRHIEIVRLVGDPGEPQVGPTRRHWEIVLLPERQQVTRGVGALMDVARLAMNPHQQLQDPDRAGVDPLGFTFRGLGQPTDGRVGLPGCLQGQSHTPLGKPVGEPTIGGDPRDRAARKGESAGGSCSIRSSGARDSASISPRIASAAAASTPGRAGASPRLARIVCMGTTWPERRRHRPSPGGAVGGRGSRPGQQPQPVGEGRPVLAAEGGMGLVFDQARRALGVARGEEMVQRLCDLIVCGEPRASPPVQRG